LVFFPHCKSFFIILGIFLQNKLFYPGSELQDYSLIYWFINVNVIKITFQLELYDQEESNSERNVANRQYGKPAASTSKADGDTSTQDKSSLFIVEKTDSDLRDEKERFYPIPGIGKRAHITLGTSEGVRPVNTGIDVLEAVQYEKEASEGNVTPATYSLPDSKSQLRCYKSGLWVLYPETHLVFDSLFTGHY